MTVLKLFIASRVVCSAAGPAPEDVHEVQCDSSGHKNGPILGRLHVSTVPDVAQTLSFSLGLCLSANQMVTCPA